jgi:hypothetical protein
MASTGAGSSPLPGRSRYAPYRSIIASIDDDEDRPVQPCSRPAKPPWRKKVGEVWFTLSSENGARWGEDISEGEEAVFEQVVSKMFANVSDKEDWAVPVEAGPGAVLEVSVDTERERGGIGVASVMYTREELPPMTSKPGRSK